jgi:hypothetical protein
MYREAAGIYMILWGNLSKFNHQSISDT